LEFGRLAVFCLSQRLDMWANEGYKPGEVVARNRLAVDLYPLADIVYVGREVGAGVQTRVLEDSSRQGRSGALALGAGYMDDRAAVLWAAKPCAESLHTIVAKLPAEPYEAAHIGDRVLKIHANVHSSISSVVSAVL